MHFLVRLLDSNLRPYKSRRLGRQEPQLPQPRSCKENLGKVLDVIHRKNFAQISKLWAKKGRIVRTNCLTLGCSHILWPSEKVSFSLPNGKKWRNSLYKNDLLSKLNLQRSKKLFSPMRKKFFAHFLLLKLLEYVLIRPKNIDFYQIWKKRVQ